MRWLVCFGSFIASWSVMFWCERFPVYRYWVSSPSLTTRTWCDHPAGVVVVGAVPTLRSWTFCSPCRRPTPSISAATFWSVASSRCRRWWSSSRAWTSFACSTACAAAILASLTVSPAWTAWLWSPSTPVLRERSSRSARVLYRRATNCQSSASADQVWTWA